MMSNKHGKVTCESTLEFIVVGKENTKFCLAFFCKHFYTANLPKKLETWKENKTLHFKSFVYLKVYGNYHVSICCPKGEQLTH